MKRALGYSVTAAVLMLSIAFAWLSATESGLRWLMARVTPFIPGELAIQEIHGRLIGPIEISRLSFRYESININIAQAELDWAPTALVRGRLHITRLYVRRAQATLHPRTQTRSSEPIAIPSVTLSDARIDGLIIHRDADSTPLELARLDIRGGLSSGGASISHLYLEHPNLTVTADGDVSASLEKRFDGHLRWSVQHTGYPAVSGYGDIQGDAAHTVITQRLETPVALNVTAHIYDLEKKPRWTADVAVDEAALQRLHADWPPLQLNGTIRANGSLDTLSAQAEVRLAYRGRGAGTVKLRAQLDKHDATPRGSMSLAWRDLAWPIADKPLRSARGEFHVDGTLNNYALRLAAALTYDDQLNAEVRADGHGSLRELQLTNLHADTLDGRIDGGAQIAWSPRLVWRANLNGKNLNPARTWHAWPGRIDVDAQARGEARHIEGTLAIDNGVLRSRPFQLHGAIAYDGGRVELRQLELRAPRTRLDARGAWGPSTLRLAWTLNLDDLSWLVPQLSGSIASRGNVGGTRQQPVIAATLDAQGLAYGARRVDTIRADIQVGADDSHATLTIDGVALPGVALNRARLAADGKLARHMLRAEFTGTNGRLEIDGVGAYTDGAWSGSIARGALTLARYGDWRSDATNLAIRRDGAHLDNWCWRHQQDRLCVGGAWRQTTTGDAQLGGQLIADVRDLAPLAAIVTRIEQPRGALNVDLRLNGTASQPRVSGHADLERAGFRIPDLNLDVRDVVVRLRPQGEHALVVEASATSGGTLRVNGRIELGAASAWMTRIAVKGDNILFANTADLQLRATPDLTLRAQSDEVRLDGKIEIPRAKVHLKKSNEATKTSADVVYVGATPSAEQAAPGRNITTNLRVVLGDDVWVDGFNFKGRIGGDLLIEERPQSPNRAQGEFHVVVGEYTVYRKTLQIERGRVIFSGGPVDDPWLDIRATRRLEQQEVVVGVRVQGSVKNPKLALISEPTMSDTDILAYMLLDHPIEQASTNEGKLLYNASNAIGLAGGEFLAKRIGSTFGIEDVRVEQQKENEASLVLGKYLSPRLYIGYGIGLFDTANELRLRYQLSRHWQVQTEAGANSGVDLLYKIER